MYIIILRASTEKLNRDIVINSIDKFKWNTKIYSNNPQIRRKEKYQNKKEGAKRKQIIR